MSRATEMADLNGNTVKWSVDSSWNTGGTLFDKKECECWGQVDYIQFDG